MIIDQLPTQMPISIKNYEMIIAFEYIIFQLQITLLMLQ